jgi:hypothetical protein
MADTSSSDGPRQPAWRLWNIVLALGAVAVLLVAVVSLTRAANTYEAGLDGHYQRTDDPKQLIVTATVGHDDEIVDYVVREDPASVRITVRARNPHTTGWNDLVGYPRPVVVTLRDPLGDRTVFDGRTGSRIQDLAASIARREVGVIDAGSYRMASDGQVELRWTDSTGAHALSDLRGAGVVFVTRGPSFEQQSTAKTNMLAFEGYLAAATDSIRNTTFVFVINFDRANAVAPDDAPFRALFVDPATVPAGAPEILKADAPAVVWVIAPDGHHFVRFSGPGALTREQVAQALTEFR